MKKYIGVVPLAMTLIGIWLTYWIPPMLNILGILIFVTCAIVAWAFHETKKAYKTRDKPHSKIVLSIAAIDIVSLICIFILPPQPRCNAREMAEHYEIYREQMDSLSRYVEGHVSEGQYISLQFGSDRVSRFLVADSTYQWKGFYSDGYCPQRLEIMRQEAGLEECEFNTIKDMLSRMDCWSVITDSRNCWIGYKYRSWMMCYFIILKEPLTTEQEQYCLESPNAIPYDDRCVFWYGTDGTNAKWPEREKRRFLKFHVH